MWWVSLVFRTGYTLDGLEVAGYVEGFGDEKEARKVANKWHTEGPQIEMSGTRIVYVPRDAVRHILVEEGEE
jgi:hypothetical protein